MRRSAAHRSSGRAPPSALRPRRLRTSATRRLALDFRGGLTFNFLGKGYPRPGELFSSSNALICDDQTALPPQFNFRISSVHRHQQRGYAGYFNPACRTPDDFANNNSPRLPTTEKGHGLLPEALQRLDGHRKLSVVQRRYRHRRRAVPSRALRFWLATTSATKATASRRMTPAPSATVGCWRSPDHQQPSTAAVAAISSASISRPYDWNPAYRAVINQPGRRYRVEDINMFGGSAMLQAFW